MKKLAAFALVLAVFVPALAAQTAQMMGLKPVARIRGGFGAWKKAGGAVEEPPAKA